LGAFPVTRFFRLSENGVRCGAEGLFVGPTPLLARCTAGGWTVRSHKRELISDDDNSKDADAPGRIHRQVIDDLDFADQFAAGLDAMRKYGVLR